MRRNKDEIRAEVLRLLSENHHMDRLRAEALTQTAEAVNEEGQIAAMLPYKVFRDDMENNFAVQIIIQYLNSKGLTKTIRCANHELGNHAEEDPSLLGSAKTMLDLDGENLLSQLVNMRLDRKDDMRRDSFSVTKEMILELLMPGFRELIVSADDRAPANSVYGKSKATDRGSHGIASRVMRRGHKSISKVDEAEALSSDIEEFGE